MQQISFQALPLSVRVMTALSMAMAWVLLAEFVIDRYGFDRALPFYRYGDLCIYDLAFALGFAVFLAQTRNTTAP
jgi:hypothetical protein